MQELEYKISLSFQENKYLELNISYQNAMGILYTSLAEYITTFSVSHREVSRKKIN